MSREDQYNVTVSVDWPGLGNLQTWDKMDGGEIDSDEAKYWPGGMAPQVSLGGRRSVGNVTVHRLYDLSRDHGLLPALLAAVGKASVTVVKQSLDVNGVSFGRPLVYTGKLKQLTPPTPDSESNNPAMIQIEVSSASVAMA